MIINLLFMSLFLACLVHIVCLMPTLIRRGREANPKTFPFFKEQAQYAFIMKVAKYSVQKRILAYYHTKIKFFGMCLKQAFDKHQIHDNFLLTINQLRGIMPQKQT